MPDVTPILKASSLRTGYGSKQVINGVTLELHSGEVVALVGHNGAGKSSLLKALFGLLTIRGGSVEFDVDLRRPLRPRELLRAGVAFVPQGSRVFTDLTVRENLELGDIILKDSNLLPERLGLVLDTFPFLKDRLNRKAGTLSGGEKQMLSLARALVLRPRLLLLDEPSLGLAPAAVVDVFGRIRQLSRDYGLAVLISEQAVREVLKISQRAYVLRHGVVTFSGQASALSDEAKLKEVFL